jgi:hypothetical protein
MFVDTAKPLVRASSSLAVDNLGSVLCHGDNGDYSQDHGPAQYFHGIATNANVGNAFPFPRRSNMHFAWATTFDALSNQYLLIAICDAVQDHPTRGAAGR